MIKLILSLCLILAPFACEAPKWTACERYASWHSTLHYDITTCKTNACVEWRLELDKQQSIACTQERNSK